MPIFEVINPADGKTYEVDAPTPEAAGEAFAPRSTAAVALERSGLVPLGQMAVGAVKSAARHFQPAADMLQGDMSGALSHLTGSDTSPEQAGFQAATEPANLPENLGGMGESALEFAAPGGVATRAMAGTKLVQGAVGAAKVAQRVPLAGKALVQALLSGGTGYVQSHDPAQAGVAAAVGAGGEVAGGAIQGVANFLKKYGVKRWLEILRAGRNLDPVQEEQLARAVTETQHGMQVEHTGTVVPQEPLPVGRAETLKNSLEARTTAADAAKEATYRPYDAQKMNLSKTVQDLEERAGRYVTQPKVRFGDLSADQQEAYILANRTPEQEQLIATLEKHLNEAPPGTPDEVLQMFKDRLQGAKHPYMPNDVVAPEAVSNPEYVNAYRAEERLVGQTANANPTDITPGPTVQQVRKLRSGRGVAGEQARLSSRAAAKADVADQSRGLLSEQLHDVVPGSAAADQAYSNARVISDNMRRAFSDYQSRPVRDFYKYYGFKMAAYPLIGAGVGYGTTHNLGGTVAGLGAGAAVALTGTPFWKSLSAATVRNIANAIEAGHPEVAEVLLNSAAKAYVSQQESPNPPAPMTGNR